MFRILWDRPILRRPSTWGRVCLYSWLTCPRRGASAGQGPRSRASSRCTVWRPVASTARCATLWRTATAKWCTCPVSPSPSIPMWPPPLSPPYSFSSFPALLPFFSLYTNVLLSFLNRANEKLCTPPPSTPHYSRWPWVRGDLRPPRALWGTAVIVISLHHLCITSSSAHLSHSPRPLWLSLSFHLHPSRRMDHAINKYVQVLWSLFWIISGRKIIIIKKIIPQK